MSADDGHTLRSERALDTLRRLRAVCRGLAGADEIVDGLGIATFRVGDRSFLKVSEGRDGVRVMVKTSLDFQELLCQGERYVRAPYIGRFGWVAVRQDRPIDWDDLADVVRGGYRMVAAGRAAGRQGGR